MYGECSCPRTYFKQSVSYFVVFIQSCCLEQYTSYCVVNMYDKFQGCTVDVQAATLILINPTATLCYVCMLNACHYCLHDISVMKVSFKRCTFNAYAHTLSLNNQYLTLL